MIPFCNGFYLFPLSRAVNSNSLIFDPSEFKIGLYYVTQGNIIIAGDLNAQYISQNSNSSNKKSKHLTDFINSNSLVPVNISNLCSGPNYSFIPSRSMIDHFLIDATTAASCHSCQVIDESRLTLTSDHFPILLKLDLDSHPTSQVTTLSRDTKCIQWHKATTETLQTYSEVLTSKIEQSNSDKYNMNVNCLADSITECLHDAAHDVLPSKPFNKYSKPYWTRDVKLAHDLSRSCRRDWLAAGKPRGAQHQSYANYKRAKCAFRKIQRQESNKYLDKVFLDLDEAAELDYRLFWRLLRNLQNKPNKSCIKLKFDGEEYKSPQEVANGFSKYFECILSDMSILNETVDDDHAAFIRYIQTEVCNKSRNNSKTNSQLEQMISSDEICFAVKQLKTRKAPGWDKVQNEHIIHGGPSLLYYISKLFNAILRNEQIPSAWKLSIIIPIYKGKGKLKSDPNNFRPISLLPCMCKLFEKVLMERINTFLHQLPQRFPCPQQQGFQKKLSCNTAAFNLQETILYNLELHSNVYVAFLDIRKAFDTVWHDALLYKLDKIGIKGKIWRLIKDSYTGIHCKVSINGILSNLIKMRRGVRQGGVTSTGFYLVFIDGLLVELQISGFGAAVCSVRSGNPALADDLALIATSPINLQKMLDIVFAYAYKWLFLIHAEKSCVLTFSCKKRAKAAYPFHIGNAQLREESTTNYLGILQDTSLKSVKRTRASIQKGRNAFHAMIGYGVKPLGINPITAISLYRKIILPSVLYGCEIWNNLSTTEINEIDKFQRYIVKRVQGLPVRTRTDMCESMLGLHPLSSEITIRKLLFLHKIISLPGDSICQMIFLRKLYLYLSGSTITMGFIPDICQLLCEYNLQYILSGSWDIARLPSKSQWKKHVKAAVHSRYTLLWRQRLYCHSDFARFRKLHTSVAPAVVWKMSYSGCDLKLCDFIARLWSSIPEPGNYLCLHCKSYYSDSLSHLVAECKCSQPLKERFLHDCRGILPPELVDTLISADADTFLTIVLSASCWSNLDRAMIDSFLSKSFSFVRSCCRNSCEHS